MNKYFLCLANSYKYGNRCLAGVELERKNGNFKLKQDTWGHPVWLRPVNSWTEAGAIPNDEATEIGIFDVVQLSDVEHCAEGAQVENYYYDGLAVVGSMEATVQLLQSLSKTNRKVLLGNTYGSISHEQYCRMDYSVLMIKAEEVECYLKERVGKQPQPRMGFVYNQIHYDFPVTDPNFRHLMKSSIVDANMYDAYYLTLSLSMLCEDRHFKLVAGVYAPQQHKRSNSLMGIPPTAQQTYLLLYRQNMSLEEIATYRGLSISTIKSHLVPLIERGMIDVHDFVSEVNIRKVTLYMRQHPNEIKLKPIYEAFDGTISYDDIRFVIAALN